MIGIRQAVPLPERKASEKSSASGDAGMASLLQLPHVDTDVTRKLTRKKVGAEFERTWRALLSRADCPHCGGTSLG